MSDKKHTPGPWKISNTGSPITHHWKIKNFDGLFIAEVNIGMSDFKANAELIARAPELLRENEELKKEIKTLRGILKNELLD